MVGFLDHRVDRDSNEARLETPRVSGYRSGMSAASLIGRRLAHVYDVAGEVIPREISVLLRTLDGKMGGSR